MISLFTYMLVGIAGPALVSGKVRGGAGVLGSLLPPDYDKMTAPPHLEGEKAEILVDLEVLGIPRFDEVIWDHIEIDGKRSWFQVQEELMLELRLSHTWREPRLNVSQV